MGALTTEAAAARVLLSKAPTPVGRLPLPAGAGRDSKEQRRRKELQPSHPRMLAAATDRRQTNGHSSDLDAGAGWSATSTSQRMSRRAPTSAVSASIFFWVASSLAPSAR